MAIRTEVVREHHAPIGALRHHDGPVDQPGEGVREHHAPVGALRQSDPGADGRPLLVREHHAPGMLFRGGFEDVEREGRGGGLLGRVLLVRRVAARASECVSRV